MENNDGQLRTTMVVAQSRVVASQSGFESITVTRDVLHHRIRALVYDSFRFECISDGGRYPLGAWRHCGPAM